VRILAIAVEILKMNEDQASVQKPYPVSCVVAGVVNFVLLIYLLANEKGFMSSKAMISLGDTPGSIGGMVAVGLIHFCYRLVLVVFLTGAIMGALVVVFRNTKNWVITMLKCLAITPVILTIAWYIGLAILLNR
jgi:hypothetical protein